MAKYIEKKIPVILFGIIIFQITLIPQLAFCQVVPNLVAAFLIALAALKEIKNVFRITFLAGFILDIVSGLPFGAVTASLILAVFAVNVLSSRFLKSPSFFILAPIIFFGVIIYNLALLGLANLGNLPVIFEGARQLFSMVGLKIIIESALALVFCKFVSGLEN